MRSRRASARRMLASVLSGALIATAALVGVAAPAQAAQAPAVSAVASVTPSTGISVAITGTGFEGAVQYPGQPTKHVYVALVEKDALTVDQASTPNDAPDVAEDGSIAATLTQTAANLDRTKQYEVIVWPSRSDPSSANLYARTDVTIDWAALFPAPVLPTPSVSLSKSSGVDPAGESITVEGAGFVANAPATSGTRPPLAGAFAGAYVVFGYYDGDAWVSAGRTAEFTKWAVHAENLASIGGAAAGGIVVDEDGAFSTTLTAVEIADAPEGARFGVRTYAAGGSTYAAFSTFTEIAFAEPAIDAPAIEVFLADGTTPYTGQAVAEGDTLVVKGTAFDPAANVGGMGVPIPSDLPQGTFVVFGSFADEWQPSAGIASSQRTMNAESRVWALAEDVLDQVPAQFRATIEASWAPISEDGSFEARVTLKTPAAPLADGNWGIYTYPGGVGTPANPAQELSVPVVYTGEDATPEEPTGPQVTVTPTALDPNVENVLTIAGTGFTGPGAAQGAYVVFGEASIWDGSGPLVADGWVDLGWVMPNQITAGAFTTTLTVPAGTLDPAKEYVVATSAAHGLSVTDRTLDTFTPIAVTAPETAVPAIFLSVPSVQQGESLTVRGTGFPAGQLVSVTVNSTPITLGSATTNASGAFAVTGTIPAGFDAGAHTVTVVSGDIVLSAPLTVTAAPVDVIEEPEAPTCVAQAVTGATFRWSVKSSFRDYINGPIANGSYSIDWGTGSGAYNTDENRGRVSFGGSASFTGHGGLLSLTLSTPRVQVYSSGSAALIANVSSKGYGDSPAVNANGVVIANLSLPRASVSGSTISWNGASATMTAAGARAFAGFYEAGAALDPVSFSFPLGAEVPCDTSTSGQLAATGGETPYGVVWVGLGMLVLGAGLVALRRRTVRA